jgi:ribosomal protein S18 acetylase RimI-like enzyme
VVSTTPFTVRNAKPSDVPSIGRYAADLVRLHHGFDADRFFLPDQLEAGYLRFLQSAMHDPDVVLLVAENDSRVVGFSYSRMESRDWNALLDAYGALNDLYVDPAVRYRGVGQALVLATVASLRAKGAQRIVLHAATANTAARKLFEKIGFRSTMIEMTLSADSFTESGSPVGHSP